MPTLQQLLDSLAHPPGADPDAKPYTPDNPMPDPGLAAAKLLQQKFLEYGPVVNAKLKDLVNRDLERRRQQP